MAALQPYVTASYADRSNEISTASFYVDGASADTASAAITAAMDNISVGIRRRTDIVDPYAFSNATPTSTIANRESKMLVSYEDTVTFKRYVMTVPMPNLTSMLILAGTDLFDMTDEPLAAFITAFEANAKTQDGNPVNVLSCKVVGRNI